MPKIIWILLPDGLTDRVASYEQKPQHQQSPAARNAEH